MVARMSVNTATAPTGFHTTLTYLITQMMTAQQTLMTEPQLHGLVTTATA